MNRVSKLIVGICIIVWVCMIIGTCGSLDMDRMTARYAIAYFCTYTAVIWAIIGITSLVNMWITDSRIKKERRRLQRRTYTHSQH